jgi:Na+/melibiose symporter-like transporter
VGREDDVPVSALRRHYGATPLHLALHVALFAAFAWVVLQVADAREAANIALWFVLAIVLHDLVLLPFYSAIDRVARRGAPRGAVNHVRVPLVLSAVLLLLFFPPILGLNDESFERVAGVEPSGYLERWLLATAVLFAASAALYAVRVRRAAVAASAS